MTCATAIGRSIGRSAHHRAGLGSQARQPQPLGLCSSSLIPKASRPTTTGVAAVATAAVAAAGAATASPGPAALRFTAASAAVAAVLPAAAEACCTAASCGCGTASGAGAAAATATAGGSGAAGAGLGCWVVLGGVVTASALFSFSSALMVPVYGLLAFFPSLKLTRVVLLDSPALYVGLSLLYGVTLAVAWQVGLGAVLGEVVTSVQAVAAAAVAAAAGAAGADGGSVVAALSPFARMFSQPVVTLLCWLHLLVLDALMAREIARDGIFVRTPTAHSVLLCFFFGPTGLLSHAITRLIFQRAAGTDVRVGSIL